MQGQPGAIKAQLLQVGLGMRHQRRDQRAEIGVLLQLPDPIEITCPGTTVIRIRGGLAPKPMYRLDLQSRVDRIRSQLHPAKGHREQRLDR